MGFWPSVFVLLGFVLLLSIVMLLLALIERFGGFK